MAEYFNNGKLPPQALDFEEAVLGAILLVKDALERTQMINDGCFYNEQNGKIYAACVELAKKNLPIDLLSVTNELKIRGELDAVGGMFYLSKLTSKVSSAANIEYHCSIIYQKWGLREIIRVASVAMEAAYQDGADLFEIQGDIINQTDRLSLSTSKEAISLMDAVKIRITDIERIQKDKVSVTGIPTGWPKLDDLLHGWQKEDFIILAARPSQGKSAFALNIGINVAENGNPVAFISLEMNQSQLVDRIMSKKTNIENEQFKKGHLNSFEWNIITNTKFNIPFYIDDTPTSNFQQLKYKARMFKRKYNIELLVIDYLQLIQNREKGFNREQEISSISRGIKLLAKELKIPIIALAQLGREAEKRNGPPILADLRESGGIEQDADIVIFPYDPNSNDKTLTAPIIEAVIAKNRNGATGIRMFRFNKPTQTIEEYNEPQY